MFEGQHLQIMDQLLEAVGDIHGQHRFEETEARGRDRNTGAPRQGYQPPHDIARISKALEAVDYSQRCRTILAQLDIIFSMILGRNYVSNLIDQANDSSDHGADEEPTQIDTDGEDDAGTPGGHKEDAMQIDTGGVELGATESTADVTMSEDLAGEVDGLEEGEASGLTEYDEMVFLSRFQEEATFEDVEGPRTPEAQILDDIATNGGTVELKGVSYRHFDVLGDGNCMERTFARALYDDEKYYPTVRAELIRHLLDVLAVSDDLDLHDVLMDHCIDLDRQSDDPGQPSLFQQTMQERA
ncbi:hypothetical protein CLAFUW4_11449 [Fulvia fulva]|nr:hypothetical protein CLAFUR4_11455 [Fulvia fulva]WPV17385.1 hypothetical protein CLAFUW4_11449 [Fulvia fulva]WPV32392.1 hypothetical protein CLAFUW7_11445 [Fulvia fulva]